LQAFSTAGLLSPAHDVKACFGQLSAKFATLGIALHAGASDAFAIAEGIDDVVDEGADAAVDPVGRVDPPHAGTSQPKSTRQPIANQEERIADHPNREALVLSTQKRRGTSDITKI
jgi:hypothetical protein